MVAWCLRRALLSGLTRRWQTGTSIVGSCWIQWFFLKVITLNPVITITPAKITRLAIHKPSVPFCTWGDDPKGSQRSFPWAQALKIRNIPTQIWTDPSWFERPDSMTPFAYVLDWLTFRPSYPPTKPLNTINKDEQNWETWSITIWHK